MDVALKITGDAAGSDNISVDLPGILEVSLLATPNEIWARSGSGFKTGLEIL